MILERVDIFKTLERLQSNASPAFGIMTPQHMVEHLVFSIRFSNEKEPQKLYFPLEKAEQIKSFVIYSDAELPIGFKAPVLPKDELLPLSYQDLSSAIEMLKLELDAFDSYFKLNPHNSPINPTMGKLTHTEWIVFHNKHFKHHFKQFNLV
ncbi:MAG: hypothetical protein ABI315_06610 [Bacteroidia bacterium]